MWRIIIATVFLLHGWTAQCAEPVTIRFALLPSTQDLLGFDFLGELNRRLEGVSRIDSVTLGDTLKPLRDGQVDLAVIPSSRLATSAAAGLAVFDFPFVFGDLADVGRLQRGALGEAILASVTSEKLVGLGYWNVGTKRIFAPQRVVASPRLADSIRGLKLLTTLSAPGQDAWRRIGVAPTSLASGEVYGALQAGAFDAAEVSPGFAVRAGVDQVTKFVALQPSVPSVWLVLANERSWNQWPLQIQSAIADRVRAAARRLDEIVPAREARDIGAMKERGLQTVSFSAANLEMLRISAVGDGPPSNQLASLAVRTLPAESRQPGPHDRDLDQAPRKTGQATLFFATDRAMQPGADPNLRFGMQRADKMATGTMTVDLGGARPAAGAAVHAGITGITPFATEADFTAELARRVQTSEGKALFIYVHGYNNTFSDAAASAALLLADLNFKGVGLVFSWPSDGVAVQYAHDETEEEVSRKNLLALLGAIRKAGIKPVHLLAHSMGNRVVTGSLEMMAMDAGTQGPFIHQLILAAPDVYVARFDQVAPSVQALSDHVTLYASSADQALACSQLLHQAPRAGQAGADRVLQPTIDTVDVSNAEEQSFLAQWAAYSPVLSLARWLLFDSCRSGHSYVMHNFSVVNDLHELIAFDAAPDKRILLKKIPAPAKNYWYWEMNRANH
jgi:esterase/lipase superfamily enzyme/TRAP-type C4-dicarboxylate transport system substrate-binding protein